MRIRHAVLALMFCMVTAKAATHSEAGRYLALDDYLAAAFPHGTPAARTLWVGGDLRQSIEQMLGHRFANLRVRYWQDGETSAWILDEIGKELPITIGVTVCDNAIVNVRVLEFRESRGWEVKYPFFTDQFEDARLEHDGRLDRKIDGITGATLSVAAVTRIARIALLLHGKVTQTGG